MKVPNDRRARPTDVVYWGLRSDVLQGRILPGQVLTEESIASKHGVSRTPVREALYRLEAEGLLERVPGYGITVRQMSPREIEQIYVVRAELESLAARLAAHSMSEQEHVKLDVLHGRFVDAVTQGDPQVLATLNLQFHSLILKAAGNDELEAIMNHIHAKLSRLTQSTLGYPGRAEAALAEHRTLIAALLARDPERAKRIARDHIRNALQVRLLMHVDMEIAPDRR